MTRAYWIKTNVAVGCMFPQVALAFACGPHNDVLKLYKGMRPIRKTTIVNPPDRHDAEAYAALHDSKKEVIEKRYAATGDMICNGYKAQGQLTIRNNMVTTAAHLLYGDMTCKDVLKPSTCKFTVTVDGKRLSYDVKRIAKSEVKCPSDRPFTPDQDWIVLELKKPVDKRVTPYKIASARTTYVTNDVMAVGRSRDYVKENETEYYAAHPKHYGDCANRKTDSQTDPKIAQVDCDFGLGSSGGSLLTRGDNPELLGILRNGPDQPSSCPPEPYQEDRGDYSSRCFHNDVRLVTGKFRTALEQL